MEIQTALSTLKPESSVEPVPQKWVARIFERLTAQLGTKVADLYAGVRPETVQSEWGRALAGFHASEIERGLRACATRPFAPTLGEFTRLCRPALDAEAAFIEAGLGLMQRDQGDIGDWTHPAVYRAACRMSGEVRAGNYREVRKRWEAVLARELDDGWGDVPVPLARIEAKVETRQPTEGERAKLREMRELMAAGFSGAEIALGMTEVYRS